MKKNLDIQKNINSNIITLKDTEHFERDWFSGDIYIWKNQEKGFTALRITVNWKHPRKEMKWDTTRTYFVISGSGTFTIDWQSKEVADGDFIIIQPWHRYEYQGKMILFENNISATNSFKDELIKVLL